MSETQEPKRIFGYFIPDEGMRALVNPEVSEIAKLEILRQCHHIPVELIEDIDEVEPCPPA